MKKKTNDIDLIVNEIIKPENKNIVIITHIRPDGDAIGSAYGLKYALEDRFNDKKIIVLCGEEPKGRIQFIYGDEKPLLTLDESDHNLIITVDTAEPVLMGINKKFADNDKIDIKIDHHQNGGLYANLNYIDETASSCGEIIYEVCKRITPITSKIAIPLYAAICSDTGNFRFSNVTASTHRITADLIDTGINASEINNKLYGYKTQKELISQRIVLNNLRYYYDNKIAVIVITNEMKSQYGITDDDLCEINSIPLEIEGVELGITIKQFDDKPDKYRVSMRSSKNVDASIICNELGGGGHIRASGALIKANNAESAEKLVVETAISIIGDSI